MIIEKPTIEKILAFTLAEVLVTMIIIVLMTLASIPVIKASKEYRAAAKDKNTWMAFYDEEDKLHVFVDGTEKADLVEGTGDDQHAKFEPPDGVTRFNVTVIGGGGGGAAGEAGIGQVKTFKADPNLTEQTYVASDTGIYQIVAVGGGGGGGGGGVLCEGGGAYSGAVQVAQVNLKKGDICNVVVGIGGQGGQRQSVGDVMLGTLITTVTIGLYHHFKNPKLIRHEFGEQYFEDLKFNTQPTHRKQGGGNGTPSIFKSNEDTTVRAAGGGGGAHERKKIFKGCKPVGGCKGEANVTGSNCENVYRREDGVENPFKKFAINHVRSDVTGDAEEIYTLEPQVPGKEAKFKVWGEIRKRTPGVVSLSENNVVNYASTEVKELLGDFLEYGNGGMGGHKHRTGYPGHDGIVLIQELPVFGGGAGSPGAISFFSYTKSPLSTAEEKEDGYIKVYPGKGGKGGSDSGQAGEDGQFSRFGTRIIADGGKGGQPRASNPASEENQDEIKAPGENGILAAIQKALKEKITSIMSQLGVEFIEEIYGGLQDEHSGSCVNPEGFSTAVKYYNNKYNGYGMKSCKANYYPLPGSGGAGGGAQGSRSFNTSEIGWGIGGNGANGIVIVTW